MRTLVLAAVLLVVFFQCCPSNVGQQIGTRTPETAAPPTIYKVGDVVKVQDHTIVLNDAKVEGGVLAADFTVENVGDEEITVSSIMSFSARKPDGTKLDFASCPRSQLDGKVLPGDKLRGNICWQGVQVSTGVKIYYTPSLFGSGAIVWELR